MAFWVEFINENPVKYFICFLAAQKDIFYNFPHYFFGLFLKSLLIAISIPLINRKNHPVCKHFLCYLPSLWPNISFPIWWENIPLCDNSNLSKRLKMQLACTAPSFGWTWVYQIWSIGYVLIVSGTSSPIFLYASRCWFNAHAPSITWQEAVTSCGEDWHKLFTW